MWTPQPCPKCGHRMFPLKSIPAQDRCANEACRWIIVTEKPRKRGRGRPFVKGNTLRPATSGMQRIFTDPVSLTIRVERADRDFWVSEAKRIGISVGEYVRDAGHTNTTHY